MLQPKHEALHISISTTVARASSAGSNHPTNSNTGATPVTTHYVCATTQKKTQHKFHALH
jgi:hypothetical protein